MALDACLKLPAKNNVKDKNNEIKTCYGKGYTL